MAASNKVGNETIIVLNIYINQLVAKIFINYRAVFPGQMSRRRRSAKTQRHSAFNFSQFICSLRTTTKLKRLVRIYFLFARQIIDDLDYKVKCDRGDVSLSPHRHPD